jgi:hypothetical protein
MAAYSLLPSTFSTIKTYLITTISSNYPALGALLENSFLIIFIDIIAWGIALFMDYADNLWGENHLFSVIRYENARKIAAFYGYTAHRKISSRGNIKVGLDANFSTLPTESITINQYDSFTINGIDFVALEARTISSNPLDDAYDDLPAGTYYVTVPVIQGELTTENNTAQGNQSESFDVSDTKVENSVFIVKVNGIAWTKVLSFFESEATDEHYTLENLASMAGVKITFGDDYRGKKLTAGDSITFQYITTDDLSGQIKSVGFEVTFNETYQYADTTVVDLYGISTSQMINADDVEDIDSIKYWGQIAASTMDDSAHQNDEVRLALQEYGGILKSKALSEYDISPDSPDFTAANRVRLLIVPTSGTVIDDTTKQLIRDYLRPLMDFTDFIEYIDVVYIDIYFKVDMEVYSNAPQDINAQIDSYLQTTYALGQLDFGQSLDHSEVVYNIRGQFSDYIKRFNLELWVTETDTSPAIQTGDVIDKTLKLGNLVPTQNNIHTCRVVATFNDGADRVETLEDNGSGAFDPVGTGTSEFISSGTINYITGAITLNLLPEVVSVASIEYQYRTYDVDGKEENIDISYNHIIRYNKSLVEIEYLTT